MKRLFIFIFLVVLTLALNAQSDSNSVYRPESFSAGLGLGPDYGGMGIHMIAYPQKNIGLFFGGGYVEAGFAYNAGIKLRIKNDGSSVDPYFVAMYGYNAVAYSRGDSKYNKVFNGPSFGFGVDIHKRRRSLGYWSFAFILPIRTSETKTWPVSPASSFIYPFDFSIGYKFIIK